MGVKQILLICAVVMGQSVLAADKKPLIADPIVEKAVRNNFSVKKPTGELTKADLEKVTILVLNNTQITDAGLKEVAKMQTLRTLRLDRTQITDEGLKDVAKLKKLDSLFLDSTQITDAGLKELAKLQKLEDLNLNDTSVTKAGVAELQKALPKCAISGP